MLLSRSAGAFETGFCHCWIHMRVFLMCNSSISICDLTLRDNRERKKMNDRQIVAVVLFTWVLVESKRFGGK